MIRKVLTILFKPKAPLQAVNNKQLFSEAQKQPQKQNPKTDSKSEQPSPQKQQNIQRDDDLQNQQEYTYQKENRNTTGWWIYRFFFWGSTFTLAYNTYLVAYHDKKTPVQEQSTAVPYFIDVAKWIYNSYQENIKFLSEPPVKKFLPDIIHPAFQPKTLVFNLKGTILHADYVFGKGNVIKKRPGLNNLLRKLSQKYEIIIFSDDQYMFIEHALTSIDPMRQFFFGAFGRESMVWHNGKYIKDLDYLNRDPKNVIVIERDIENLAKHSQNAIVLKEFTGDQSDQELLKLIPLLERLADPSIRDVRRQLTQLGQNPIETYYTKLQQRKKNIQKKQNSVIGGLFGGRPTQNYSQNNF